MSINTGTQPETPFYKFLTLRFLQYLKEPAARDTYLDDLAAAGCNKYAILEVVLIAHAY